MIITYHGGQCFKVSVGDTALVFNPISSKSKLNSVKFGTDIALVSINHPDFNGVEQVLNSKKDTFIIRGPGEYESGQVSVHGFGIKTTYEGVERYNTLYQVRFEEINIIFLGAVSNPEIDSKILGELGDVDILFVPIGGGDVLEVSEAARLAVKLEAKITIPTFCTEPSIKAFLKETGNEGTEAVEKLNIKKKDLLEKSSSVVFFPI